MPKVIKFYEVGAPYGELSNFYVRSIVVNSLTWPVGVEQAFQAMKTLDKDMQEYIRIKLTRPGQIKNFCSPGGGMGPMRPDWEHSVQGLDAAALQVFTDDRGLVVDLVKDHFMYQALTAKFTQHADLAKLLLGTGDAYLIEDTQKVGSDPYWGNGPSGTGYNKLGRMLMLVRKALPRHLATVGT